MHTFYVPDMNCKHCEKRITEALKEAGITNFTVDLENKKVEIDGLPSGSPSKIIEIIEEAGYTPTAG